MRVFLSSKQLAKFSLDMEVKIINAKAKNAGIALAIPRLFNAGSDAFSPIDMRSLVSVLMNYISDMICDADLYKDMSLCLFYPNK